MPSKRTPVGAQAPSTFRSLLAEDAVPHPMLADDAKVTAALKELGAEIAHVKAPTGRRSMGVSVGLACNTNSSYNAFGLTLL